MATTYSSTKSGSTSKTYASGTVSSNTQKNKDKYGQEYVQSGNVQSAYEKLQSLTQNKPGTFQSSYQDQLNDIYDRIQNREKFQFDMNESMVYDQLKNQYAALGKLAMQDTMGQAASMTGGYGNSYAQTAGQQTYQSYMQQLQEQIPNLYQMELSRYTQEGEDMMNQYNMAKNMYDTEYGKYRDEMSDFYTERDYLNSQYQSERDFDYNQYMANRDYWANQYWNEKNSAQTTESSSWQTTTSTSSGSGSSKSKDEDEKSSSGASAVPLSTSYVKSVIDEANKLKTDFQKKIYIDALYNNNKLSESHLNYFYDVLGL